MNPAQTLAKGRRLAAKLMVDQITITRLGQPTADPETGADLVPETTIYFGPGRVSSFATGDRTVALAGATAEVSMATLHLPTKAAVALRSGDKVLVRSANPVIDGNVYRVDGVVHTSFATSYQYRIQQVNA